MEVNLCKKDGPISVCSAEVKTLKNQGNCKYYGDISRRGRCMFTKFGKYCDNYCAQHNLEVPKIVPHGELYVHCKGCSHATTCVKRGTAKECDAEGKRKEGVYNS